MGTVVVLGEAVRVRGYALAGAVPVEAETPAQVRDAWTDLAKDVTLVVLTPSAAAALAEVVPSGPTEPLTVVMAP